MDPGTTIFGFPIRLPSETESAFFQQNPHVGGMAAEDNTIVLNPFSSLSDHEKEAVAKNEAVRLWLRQHQVKVPAPTPAQRQSFQGTPYEHASETDVGSTILGRMLSGDPSAGVPSRQQSVFAGRLQKKMDKSR